MNEFSLSQSLSRCREQKYILVRRVICCLVLETNIDEEVGGGVGLGHGSAPFPLEFIENLFHVAVGVDELVAELRDVFA